MKKRHIIQFIVEESNVVTWQSLLRKLVDMPRVGFNRMFTVDEFELIDELAELSNIEKGKDVSIRAENSHQEVI